MSVLYGNNTATERQRGAMRLVACNVHGALRWKLETFSAGRRKRQFFADRKVAEKALEDAQKQQAAVGKAFDVLSAREKGRIMAVLADIERAGLTLEGVWKAAQSVPALPGAACALDKAITEVLAAKREANCSKRHVDNLDWYLGKFAAGREKMDVSAITVQHLEDWFTARQEKPRAKKGHVSLLSCLFSHCQRKGYITDNPVARLNPVHIDRGVPATLSNAQAWKAALFARRRKPKLLGWLALTLFAGLRPDSEADFITWGDIDLKRGRVTITKSKIRSHRIIELSFCPPAWEWLRVAKELKAPLPLTFITRRRYVRAVREYLKLKRWPQDILRHTAASNLLAFHQDAGKVALFLGHSAGTLLRDYKALVFREDAEKFMKLLPKKRHYR